MAITILKRDAAMFGYGIPQKETGVNISRFVVRYYPEVDEIFPNLVGNAQVRAVSQKLTRVLECEGEIMSDQGLLAFTMSAACTFANATTYFGSTTGTFYMDEATVSYNRRNWLTVSMKATARPTLG